MTSLHALYMGDCSQQPASRILRASSLHADFGVGREGNIVRENVGERNTATLTLERRCSKLQRTDQGRGQMSEVAVWYERLRDSQSSRK
jgi:hypothetical protein